MDGWMGGGWTDSIWRGQTDIEGVVMLEAYRKVSSPLETIISGCLSSSLVSQQCWKCPLPMDTCNICMYRYICELRGEWGLWGEWAGSLAGKQPAPVTVSFLFPPHTDRNLLRSRTNICQCVLATTHGHRSVAGQTDRHWHSTGFTGTLSWSGHARTSQWESYYY